MAEVTHSIQPPPIPGTQGPGVTSQRLGVTYLIALTLIIPPAMLLAFSIVIHLPKLEVIWREAGIDNTRAQWLLELCRFLPNNFYFLVAAGMIFLVIIECSWKGWARWRKLAVYGAVFLFHLFVMLELAFVATASQLAVGKMLANMKDSP
jgi:hypothetical protein